jgi:hypothetical protein
VIAAQKVRRYLVDLVLQGSRMQTRVFCGPDQFHHIVRPLAEGTKATILADCYADTVTVVEAEVVAEAKIFGDETPPSIATEDCDLFSLVHNGACGGCPSGGHVGDFVLRNGKASCYFHQQASSHGLMPSDYSLTGKVQLRDVMLKPMDLTSAGFRGGSLRVVASFQWTDD